MVNISAPQISYKKLQRRGFGATRQAAAEEDFNVTLSRLVPTVPNLPTKLRQPPKTSATESTFERIIFGSFAAVNEFPW